jgi:hypothetical protein
MRDMRHANEVSTTIVKRRVELLMNYFDIVVRWQDEHLRAAMMDYRESLTVEGAEANERSLEVAA